MFHSPEQFLALDTMFLNDTVNYHPRDRRFTEFEITRVEDIPSQPNGSV